MNKKEILNDLRELVNTKRNEYIDKMNQEDVGSPYWNYCRGKKDLLEDIISYIASKL